MKPEEIATEVRLMAERLGDERLTTDRMATDLNGIGDVLYLAGLFDGTRTDRVRRLVVQRDTERARADAAEKEVARLTVAKLPTAEDYARLVKEKNEQRARADAAELARDAAIADRDYWQRRFKTMEDYANALHEQQDLIERIVPEATRQKCADYDEYRTHVDAAFTTLGKRDDESYEGCASRISTSLIEAQARAVMWNGRFDTAFSDLAFVGRARDEAYRQRDAAVAELARVREALNVLLREGGKAGVV